MEIRQCVSGMNVDFSMTEYSGCEGTLLLSVAEKNLTVIKTAWRITRPGSYLLRTTLTIPFKEPELFIPSVLYRENNCGTGAFPRGSIRTGLSFREERTPLPGCVLLSEKNNYSVFCLGPEYSGCPAASVSAHTKGEHTVIEMQVPAQERPFSYQGKTRKIPAELEEKLFTAAFCSEETPLCIERTQFLYIQNVSYPAPNTLFSVYRIFASLVTSREEFVPVNNGIKLSWDRWVTAKLGHLEFLTDMHRDDGTAFVRMGKGNGNLQPVYDFTGASFLVKSIEGAWVFARAGKTELAEAIGRYFLHAEADGNNGIYRDNYSLSRSEWGGYLGVSENSEYGGLVNARCNGEAMLAYIRLYEALAARNIVIPQFIELPLRVARFYINCQIKDVNRDDCGSFGRWWTPEGKAVNAGGTNGAYIVSFLLALIKYADAGLKKDLSAAIGSASDYYHKMIRNADYYGDTLDADAFDKESAAVLTRESLDMYDFTGDTSYLEDARDAACFVYTWMWLYDVRFPEHTPLAELSFRTRGMTAVSVAHHHLDFYGMYLARDFLRLYKACGDRFFRDTAVQMLDACRQLTATKEHPLGRDHIFCGWQPEQVNHTQWDYFDRPDHMQGYYDICIAWVPVLTLGAYFQIKDEYPQVLEE